MPKKSSSKKRNRTIIEWAVIIGVILVIYAAGLHTQVIGTLQRGLLATGLIKPDVPSLTEQFPEINGNFYFADRNGTTLSLANFEGQVVFLNVWATWCPPCIAEMPSIQSLYNRLKNETNITFLLVSLDEDFEKAEEFMRRRDLTVPVYHYRSRSRQAFESTVVPTTYIITRDGRMALEKRGLAKYDTPGFETFLLELSKM